MFCYHPWHNILLPLPRLTRLLYLNLRLLSLTSVLASGVPNIGQATIIHQQPPCLNLPTHTTPAAPLPLKESHYLLHYPPHYPLLLPCPLNYPCLGHSLGSH